MLDSKYFAQLFHQNVAIDEKCPSEINRFHSDNFRLHILWWPGKDADGLIKKLSFVPI